ncbi:MAG: GNAT family N-acetyltransferase [Dehalococcoidia bacterium]
MKVAETSRLALRLISLSDLENLHGLLYADPEVAIPWVGHVQSLQDLSSPNGLLSQVARAADEPGLLVVERNADYAMIGVAGILPLRRASDSARFVPANAQDVVGTDPGRREGELVVALGRAHWNRGYATEAGMAAIGLGFNSWRFARIIASVGPANDRAMKMLRRLGFRIEPNGRADPRSGASLPGSLGFLDATARR